MESLGGIGSLVGAGAGLIGSLFGKNTADQVQLPQQWTMPNMSGAANAAYQGIQNIPGADLGQWAIPSAQQAAGNILNNPGANQFVQGAYGASNMGMQQAGNQYGLGNYLSGAGAGLLPYAQGILNTGFDPQNALYARTQQQLQDQTRAGQAARGVAMTPYGAGLENQAMSNFNLDWQNALLGRQTSAAQGASSLVGAGGQGISAGQTLASQAPGQMLTSAMYPYTAYNTIGKDQLAGLSGALGVGQQGQQVAAYPAQQNLAYLGVGNQAQGVANQTGQLGLNQAQLGFNQDQTLGANLGRSLQGLSNPNNWSWMNTIYPKGGGNTGSSLGWGASSFGGSY